MFSVVILTLNEATNLPACLATLPGVDDVLVVDSGSTDSTAKIALGAGARVITRPFDNFAAQRNYAHTAGALRHAWAFHLDADERMRPELLAECRAIATRPPTSEPAGYYCAPRMLWRGQWIPSCTDYPAWQARFVRPAAFQFMEVGHGQREAPGLTLGQLTSSYDHLLDTEGVDGWLAKHARYARREASAAAAEWRPFSSAWHEWRAAHGLARRRALKRLSLHLPLRGFARLIYQYFLRGGFREGAAGWEYCRLLARYEAMVTQELRAVRKTTPLS
jgi:glycosyltransferase involved in cell wall biosynthesis